MLFSKTEKRFTKLRSPENVGTESKRAEGAGCRVSEEGMNRVSLPVELERGVVRQHRIRRQLRGHEEQNPFFRIGFRKMGARGRGGSISASKNRSQRFIEETDKEGELLGAQTVMT